MPLKDVGYEQAEEHLKAKCEIISCQKEYEMVFEMFRLINELSPDVVCGYQLYGNIQQILKRMTASLPFHIIQENVLIVSRYKTNLGQNSIMNVDPMRLVHQIFMGRVCADLEKVINEFSPDNKQTSIDYALSVLEDKDLVLTPNVFLIDYYKDLGKFKSQIIPELVRE